MWKSASVVNEVIHELVAIVLQGRGVDLNGASSLQIVLGRSPVRQIVTIDLHLGERRFQERWHLGNTEPGRPFNAHENGIIVGRGSGAADAFRLSGCDVADLAIRAGRLFRQRRDNQITRIDRQ